MPPAPRWPFALLVVLSVALSACGGCSDEPFPGSPTVDGGPSEGNPETGPIVDPCAPPAIDGTAAASFADAIRFLYEGACPRQTKVDKSVFDDTRVAVVRGRVLDEAGKPLPNVRVRTPREPRYGETLTDNEGRFGYVVLGGSSTRLRFELEGKLLSHRSAEPKPNRYGTLEDVTLVAPSAKKNAITFGQADWQVASGDPSKDESDTRTAVVLVPPGTRADTVKADGTKAPLASGTLRITEFSRGKPGPSAMPGELPPASAYTYASGFSLDEAGPDVRVAFDTPVVTYVDNFLHMKVGAPVPAGALEDSDLGWKAEASGLIVSVLPGPAIDANGDGTADSADELAKLGITAGELGALGKAGLAPGKSYLRVPMAHFSSWDLNWPFGPPPDSVFPPDGDGKGGPGLPCLGNGGSWYECEKRTLAEDIPLVGTSVYLHYHSDRVPGRKDARSIEIPLTGATVPPSAKRAEITVSVLGTSETKVVSPLTPNLVHTFTWSGKDAYGRDWPGQTVAEVRVGIVYDGVYQNVRSFGAFGDGEAVTGDKTRQEIGLNRRYEVALGARDQTALGLGGWSLSEHHVYDPAGRVLYMGDGTTRYAADSGATLRIIAGTGTFGGGGDGGPATSAELASPEGVAVDGRGTIYVSETLGHRVRKIEKGIITTFAGTGTQGHTGDGGQAKSANIDTPRSVTVLRDGRVCFAEQYSDAVRCVGADGVIRTVLGGGTKTIGVDPQPATDVVLSRPTALAEGPDGSLYATSEGTGTIVRLDPGGKVETCVGGGSDSGESVPARRTNLLLPRGITVGPDGTMYIAEQGRNRVRRVDPSGLVTTFAGSGDPGAGGDGGPAASATFRGPTAVALDIEGALYVADQGNLRIRRVDRGRVQAYAGGGDRTALEGSSGRLASISTRTLAVGPDGTLYATEESLYRVVSLRSPFPGTASGETLLPNEAGSEIFVFDSKGRHLRTLDGLTYSPVLTFTYDAQGRLSKLEDKHQNALTIVRDGSGRATQITGPFGHASSLAYDGAGYLAEVTDVLGRKERFEYAAGGLLTKRTDQGGGVHTMSYDAEGRLLTDANAENQRVSFTQEQVTAGTKVDLLTGLGRRESHVFKAGPGVDEVRSLVDRDGTTLAWTQKKSGVTQATLPDGTTLDVVSEADPRLGMLAPYAARHTVRTPSGIARPVDTTWAAATSPTGDIVSLDGDRRTPDGRTTMRYDGASRTWTVTSPMGRVSRTTVDAEGRVVRSEAPGFAPVDLVYDARSRLATASWGARRTSFTYGAKGSLVGVEDPLARKVAIDRDGAERPTSFVHTDAARSGYAWSAMDDLVGLTPPGKGAHAMSYGKDGLEATYTAPGSNAVTLAYDGDRELSAMAHEDGSRTEITRDVAGRPSRMSYAGGAVSIAYDAVTGQATTLIGPGANGLGFRYDGVLLREVTATGDAPGTLVFAHDTMFRHTSESVGGNAVTYAFDTDGLLTRAGSVFLTREGPTGRLSALSVGLAGESFTYTPFGELATYQARSALGSVLDMALSYDNLGRLTEKRENGITYTYSYDVRGRLARVLRDGTEIAAYAYDANGNRSDAGRTADARDRITARSGATYAYDAKGQRTSKTEGATVTRYGYDGRGHLASAEVVGTVRVDYDLDAYGRRVTKRRNGTVENRYLYRNQLQPAAEVDAAGNVLSRYVYARGELAPDLMERAGASYALLKDERGSIRAVVDVFTGVVAQALEYDPFGKVTADSNPGFQPFGFAGGMYDADTGLTHFGAREYDAETGSFTRADPSGFAGGENRYVYAGGDPVNFVDPDGNFIAAVVVGAAVGGAEGGYLGYVDEAVGQALDPDRVGYDCAAIRASARRGAVAGAITGGVSAGARAAGSKPRVEKTPSGKRKGDYTPSQRAKAKEKNATANGGKMACTDCGRGLESVASQKGVPTPANQAQVHHNPPIVDGGGRTSTPEVYCPECHRKQHK